ncbi:hypothetical protein BAUCODRAFT_21234 [Baudoinia panamericana UAMH 10762]|uniref:Heterokaryon incompatibility domain-containing protein n=1 Tax=Baudoinia panamericana (strain UAMH 10762) TaxID=717646 RepID=M2N5X0_BAUPA|nr:uncharacterized protein BAUCODRAFT_21234 [Baudoinia panamericana UAMH 10762]EMC99423.1 hypothetical protein BAUCODRAFT_21234 [Baudoinia panamericana UAMH 10762]
MENTIYTVSLKDGQLRLLHLSPGCDSEPLTCMTSIEDADAPQHYEAVSYLWGSMDYKEVVHCASRDVEVTRNGAQALRRLRLKDNARVLWMDQICINQADLQERSQ